MVAISWSWHKRLSWIIWAGQCNHKGPYEWKTQRDGSVRRTQLNTADFEDRGRKPWAKESKKFLEAEKGKKTDSLQESANIYIYIA